VPLRAVKPLAVALVLTLLGAGAARAATTAPGAELAGCTSPDDPDCSVPPSSPPPPGGGGGGTAELPKLVAWTSAYDINPFNGSRGGIFISRTDGSGQRRLTEFANGNKEFTPHGLNAPDDHPSFSHDGRRIVFSSNRANRDDWDIYVMNVNGANVQRLTSSPGLDTEPVFSPDDQLIVFSSARSGNLGLWAMRADGTNEKLLFDTPIAELEPAWRPDGKQIVFTHSVGAGNKDLFTLDVTRPSRAGLVTDPADLVAGAVRQLTFTTGEDHDGTYSPDGSELVFTTEREPFDPPYGNTHKLRLSDLVDEGDLTANLDLGAGDPFWSFDGRRVAFFKSSTRFINSPQQLWIMAADGSQKARLPGGSGVANVHPAIGRVADTDDDGTPDYLESGSVGRPTLRIPRRVRAGRRFRLRLGWLHPVRWKLLRSELLVFTLGRTPVGLVRFDIRSQLFFTWNSSQGRYGAHGRAGRRRTLRAGALSVDLGSTRVIKVDRRRLTLDLALRFGRRAIGRTIGLEARADDARGASQQDRRSRARISVRR
jgi:Tol biopolymer transport system component